MKSTDTRHHSKSLEEDLIDKEINRAIDLSISKGLFYTHFSDSPPRFDCHKPGAIIKKLPECTRKLLKKAKSKHFQLINHQLL